MQPYSDETEHLERLCAELIRHGLGARLVTKADWLDGLAAKLATRSHSILKRSIRQAQARDRVLRNVAELVTTPKGKLAIGAGQR